jgi:alcohol dehydrogenase, propanol-preferring
MRVQELRKPASISHCPLVAASAPIPEPANREVLIRVHACGVCRTDLHLVEGELPARRLPIIPGHQAVGIVLRVGSGVTAPKVGDRVGVPWLHKTCGECDSCLRGEENLCPHAEFTGWDCNGGFAEYLIAESDFVIRIPPAFSDEEAAPLLCAGVIGYRSLHIAGVVPREHVGLFGFGASAHLALQVLLHWNCAVSVFTRGAQHRAQALSQGAVWTGSAEDAPPAPLDRAILFAPAGELVPLALRNLRPGGALALNAIHMSDIPALPYPLLYGERTIRSVAHATRKDAADFMALAERIPIHAEVQTYSFEEGNTALSDLKAGAVHGAAVLTFPH